MSSFSSSNAICCVLWLFQFSALSKVPSEMCFTIHTDRKRGVCIDFLFSTGTGLETFSLHLACFRHVSPVNSTIGRLPIDVLHKTAAASNVTMKIKICVQSSKIVPSSVA